MSLVQKKCVFLISIIVVLTIIQTTCNIILAQQKVDTSFNFDSFEKSYNNFNKERTNITDNTFLLSKALPIAKEAIENNLIQQGDSIINYCLTHPDSLHTTSAELLYLNGKLLTAKRQFDEAINSFSNSLNIAIKNNNSKLIGNIYNNIGVAYWLQRNYPQALDFFDKTLDYAVKHTNETLRLKALTNKGIVYSQFANYSKAIECLLLANEIAYKNGNKQIEANSLNSLGNIYLETEQSSKALKAYVDSKDIFTQLDDKVGISISLNNIGEVYLKQNNTALALENYFKSLSIQEQSKDTNKIAVITVNIGNTHFKSGQYKYAIRYYQKALELISKNQDLSLKAEIVYHLGITLFTINNFGQAEEYLKQASKITIKLGEKEKQAKCLLALSELYEKQFLYKQALLYKNQYAVIKDSILSDKTIEYMARMDAIYRSIKKEKIIHDLTAEQRVKDQLIIKEKNSRVVLLTVLSSLAILTIILLFTFFIIRRANRKMKDTNEKLQQLNATKDKFFSIISHDLKSPINSILGFSEMLVLHAESNDIESLKEFSQMVHSNSKKLYSLVDNLLLWSRTQVGSTRYTPERLDISIQCHNIISLLRLSSEEKDILISGKIEKDLTGYGDINLFNTIMRNLISNAIKFSRVGGSILVTAKKTEDVVELAVEDSGVGISSENMEKLFRIDSSFTTKGTFNEKGSGLGLILCKEFVEINKGQIWAESELGKGSKFIFTIPVAEN